MTETWTHQASIKDDRTGLLLNVRGDLGTFETNLALALDALSKVRELESTVRGVLAPVDEGQNIAYATQALGAVPVNGVAAAPVAATQPAPVWSPQPAAPAAPAPGGGLPPTLARFNTLIPGMPVDACSDCGMTTYPVTFKSNAGKEYSKYKCGTGNKDHNSGGWIR